MMGGLLVGDFIAGGAGLVQQMATVSRRCSAKAYPSAPGLRRNWSMRGCAAGCDGLSHLKIIEIRRQSTGA